MSEQAREAQRLRAIKRRLDAQLSAVETGLAAIVRDWVNPTVVATVLGCTPQGANNHLKRLLDVDLVERRRYSDGPRHGFEYRISGDWL